ncbi:restriction endonuclease [Paraburkholderia tropica]|uniref:restriction endonuclease n=1 Tax=Paraburkholderia tropica TaxID=92647 RepID=UPI002AB66277|nr:restriction endonuclease [Paraburkholderia tropica]
MPQRTNHFQKLVKVITTQLGGEHVQVIESAMLYDREADCEREVDILVVGNIASSTIKIGIECTAKKSPVDVRIIEGFKDKHRKLGINKTIVVSKSGFTRSAKICAETNHISALTIRSAEKENWSQVYEKLKGLSVYGRSYSFRSISLTFEKENAPHQFIINAETEVFFDSKWISIFEFGTTLFTSLKVSEKAFKEMMENEKNNPDPYVEVGFDLGLQYEFRDTTGCVVKPTAITLRLAYRSNYRALNPEPIVYDDQEMIAGGFFDSNGVDFAHIAARELNGTISGTLEFSGNLIPSPDSKTV